jgi:uncharacterized protein
MLRQSWCDLLFAHWPVDAAVLRPHVPEGLTLDLFEGRAWLTVAPFLLANLRWRALPPVPTASTFPELNVRTYVHAGGRGGVWFFSLDAASAVAVAAARLGLRLPYRHAAIEIRREASEVRYTSTRLGRPDVRLRATYTPTGPAYRAAPGSLDEWLVERYCLYTRMFGREWRLEIDHPPWPLQPARVTIDENTMAAPLGLTLGAPAVAHFAERLDVLAWLPYPVS